MTWFKVDDGWWSHPKVIPVESDARGIWVSAGSWCAQHLTDGFLPEYALKMVTELRGNKLKAACEELIEAGLWKRRPGGFLFHDWEKYQPIREDVEKKRAADRERKAASRVRADSERKPRRFGKESNPPGPSRPVHTPIPPPFRDVVRELDERVRADERATVNEIFDELDARRDAIHDLVITESLNKLIADEEGNL
jgi:hypothetical protein